MVKDEPTIMQIMPAPPGLHAVYYDIDQEGTQDEVDFAPVMCLALIVQGGDRWVLPLEFDPDTGVDSTEVIAPCSNRIGYTLDTSEMALAHWLARGKAWYLEKHQQK